MELKYNINLEQIESNLYFIYNDINKIRDWISYLKDINKKIESSICTEDIKYLKKINENNLAISDKLKSILSNFNF